MHKLTMVGLLLVLLSVAVGCSDDASPEPNDENIEREEVAASPQRALAIDSNSGCALDSDCASGLYCFQGYCASACAADADCPDGRVCSERGSCDRAGAQDPESDSGEDLNTRALLEVMKSPQVRFAVASGQSTVRFKLELNRAAPSDGVAYRIDRSDDPASAAKVRYTSGGSATVEFLIPVGKADPSLSESGPVQLNLSTPLGSYEVLLYPEYSIAGGYFGSSQVEAFGQTALPMQFEIVTKPDGATLEAAEKAWLLLPVGSQYLFSPISDTTGAVEYVASELIYDDFVRRWVAKFESKFDLSAGAIIASEDDDQVQRSMRFELERLNSDTLIGSFNDRWSGLYEARSVRGVTALQDVTFTGGFEVKMMTPARSYEGLELAAYPGANPQLLPPPPLDACTDASIFDAAPLVLDPETTYDCAGIDTPEQFEQADPTAQAACAIAVAHAASQGETTISQIEGYLNGEGGNDGEMSFADFMQACAAHVDDLCVPTPQVLCGRQLVARAYEAQGSESTVLDALVSEYHSLTREAFFGDQVAAFGSDTSLRLEWLQASDWPPTFSGLKNLVAAMMEEWKLKVLETHIGALKGQFDPSGLAVMSRQVDQPEAAAAREQLLLGMTQSWRGSVDALVLASQRWNILFQDDASRAEQAAYVSARLFDLYLSAGILKDLNTAAGVGYLSARLAGGLDVLVDELGALSLPFNKLIYARDGEVVVSTSLDPSATNLTLLGNLRTAALAQIDDAHQAVTTVLAEARAEALSQEQLGNEMGRRVQEQRADLLSLCGHPVGCEQVNYLNEPPAGCAINFEAGTCGFQIDKNSGEVAAFGAGAQNVSEAGRVLLELAEAANNISIAEADRQALAERIMLRFEELEAFAGDIEQWNQLRGQFADDLQAQLAARAELRSESVEEILGSMQQRAELRQQSIDASRSSFSEWEQIRSQGESTRMSLTVASLATRTTAGLLSGHANSMNLAADIAADGMPHSVGTANDPSFAARLAVRTSAYSAARAMTVGSKLLQVAASAMDAKVAAQKANEEGQLRQLDQALQLDKEIWLADIAALEREEKTNELLTNAEIENIDGIIELSRQLMESELAHQRDLSEFRRRRSEVFEMITEVMGLDLHVEQARLQYYQVMERYAGVVQRARLTHVKLENAMNQRTNINALVGSPGVLFSRANELEAAERELLTAKAKLMNWLVALEYYAVRPFIDQRMQILLARNTYQLGKISEELEKLENRCGGPSNDVTAVLSLRKDLLGITREIKDPVSGTSLSPVARFHEILERGYVPVDKRVRYSTNTTVGGLMAGSSSVMSGTFFIDLTDFANLGLTCNAKVKSLALNLVGEGMGSARPTVTVLYDGASKLRSCQPGIADYVDLIGATATTYGEISRFQTPGRSMSPVASVNGFEENADQASTTLSGLPLSSQYTVLINKAAGENKLIDWSKLEDVELRVTYSYQDVFPDGQCEL